MTELAAAADPVAAPAPEETTSRRVWSVVLLSVAVTVAAMLAALVPAVAFDVRWSLAFVYLRWGVVFALLALPLVHQLVVRSGRTWELAWGLRTPATGLLLTVEGICWDILSAQLRG